jgi:transposase
MSRLIKNAERKVFLILDNLKSHHAKLVDEWLKERKEQIELFFLPPYAPEYNPDEYLNGMLKRKMAEKQYATTVEEIESNARGIMKTIQYNTELVASFFDTKSTAYAA